MKVLTRRLNDSPEKKLLEGMILSDKVLMEVSRMLTSLTLFATIPARIVGKWCLDYYKQHKKAPREDIRVLLIAAKNQGNRDEDTLDLVESIVETALKSAVPNEGFLIDEAEKYLKLRSYSMMAEDLKAAIDTGKVEDIEELIQDRRKVTRAVSTACNPLLDQDLIQSAFEYESQPLFRFPGALGEMINPHLCRDSFLAFMAPEKRGKTWWLLELAMRALRNHCKVAFFEAGDMTRYQVIHRLHNYIMQKSFHKRQAGKILVPVLDCWKNQKDLCKLPYREGGGSIWMFDEKMTFEEARQTEYRPCTYCKHEKDKLKNFMGAHWFEERVVESYDWRESIAEAEKFTARHKGELRLAVYSNDSLSVPMIDQQLDQWAEEDFIPEVVIVDYADILEATSGGKEFRHQENGKWKGLRRISQDHHCFLATATQTDSEAYDKFLLTMDNYSEDKRKFAHVTAMLGLNQTPEEKRDGVMRINQVVVREGEYDIEQTVTVLMCLKIGRPYLDSYWSPRSVKKKKFSGKTSKRHITK